MQKTKVMFLASGKSFHASRWANYLSENEYEIHFVSVQPFLRKLNKDVKTYQIGYRNLGKINYLLGMIALKKLTKLLRPKIVHAHYATGYGFLASVIAKQYNSLLSLYGSDLLVFPKKSFLHMQLLKSIISKYKKQTVTSMAMLHEYQRNITSVENVELIPFGVDLNLFKRTGKYYSPIEKGVFTIGIVKKLEYVYGIDVFLRALSKLVSDGCDVELRVIIVGGGSLEQELKNLANELGVLQLINFIGWVGNEKLPIIFESFDVAVIPSRSESFGVSALEAQALSVPVIASRVGGLVETVFDGGLFFEVEDYHQLTAKLKFCMDNPKVLNQISIDSYKHVVDNYNWNESLNKMKVIYEKVIEAGGY